MDIILVLLASLGFGFAWEFDWYPALQQRGDTVVLIRFTGIRLTGLVGETLADSGSFSLGKLHLARKPWSCPLCMSAQSAVLFSVLACLASWEPLGLFWKPVLSGFAAYGLAYVVRLWIQYLEDMRI